MFFSTQFVAENIAQVLENHDIKIEVHLMQIIVFIPILLSCLILKLKYIGDFYQIFYISSIYLFCFCLLTTAICSALATVCMVLGLFFTIGYVMQDLPDLSCVPIVAEWERYPIFFGTVLFAFEGIALVLPVSTAMYKPKQFNQPLGVLNVGIAFTTLAYVGIGFIGYWRYGEATAGSITLNLKADEM